ncbi:unnamed protein product [Brassicogethes aeneus]|uniref:Uncharacterized protein n=1 Tax=Brassicogethes aeneus TaxID=1431903 RepID=A0A9P0BB26_BRAAE|nr:unnamed protein product [Brassicogethes aeneus]
MCSILTNTDSYQMFHDLNREVPNSLMRLTQKVLLKIKKGNVEQTAKRPRSFKSQIGLSVVVFDGYADSTKNIKGVEQRRRAAVASTSSCAVRFNEAMDAPISQEKFISNIFNRKQWIDMLTQLLGEANIEVKQARDDADVLIVETAIE